MDRVQMFALFSLLVISADSCRNCAPGDAQRRRTITKHLKGVWPKESEDEIFKETIRDFGVDSEAMKMEEEDGIIGNVRDAMAKVESDVIDIFELAQDMADNEK